MERFAGGAIPAKLFRGYEAQFSRTEGLLLGPSGAWNLVPHPHPVKTILACHTSWITCGKLLKVWQGGGRLAVLLVHETG